MEQQACRVFIYLIWIVCLVRCTKELPNPEILDPIYKDLSSRADSTEKEMEELKVKIEELRKTLARAAPNSIDRQDILRELKKASDGHVKAQQLARYLKIRAERRKVEDRAAYMRSLASQQPWPDPNEYSHYQKNIQLREAPVNWSVRVPKLQQRLDQYRKSTVPRGTETRKSEKKEE